MQSGQVLELCDTVSEHSLKISMRQQDKGGLLNVPVGLLEQMATT